MIDIVGGKIRVRKWPRKRRRAKTTAEQQGRDKFAAAQRAAKYIAPGIMKMFTEKTQGTPLLPRDLSTMMLYNRMYAFQLPDGRKVYPMPAYNDVSEALDVISNLEGMTLKRGANGWEAAPYGEGGGGWELIKQDDMAVVGPTTYSQIDNAADYNEIFISLEAVYMTTIDSMRVDASVNDGLTWQTGSSAYGWIRDLGRQDAQGPPLLNSANNIRPVNAAMQIFNFDAGIPSYFNSLNIAQRLGVIAGTNDKITNLRVHAFNNSTLYAGLITWMGRP